MYWAFSSAFNETMKVLVALVVFFSYWRLRSLFFFLLFFVTHLFRKWYSMTLRDYPREHHVNLKACYIFILYVVFNELSIIKWLDREAFGKKNYIEDKMNYMDNLNFFEHIWKLSILTLSIYRESKSLLHRWYHHKIHQ